MRRALGTLRPATLAITIWAPSHKENPMTLGTILLIVLILLLVGAIPTWPHSRSWGYGPTGGLGLVLVIVIVLLVMGVI
jgi:hypothetical protein